MAFGFLFSYIPSFPIPAAGREISILWEKVRSVWRRIELAEGKGRLLGTTGSPISIIPCLEKLDLQSKSIFWLNLCSNGKKTKNWASFEGLDTRCYQFLNCAGRIVCVERTGDLLSLPIFLLEFTFLSPFPISWIQVRPFPVGDTPALPSAPHSRTCPLLCLHKQITA